MQVLYTRISTVEHILCEFFLLLLLRKSNCTFTHRHKHFSLALDSNPVSLSVHALGINSSFYHARETIELTLIVQFRLVVTRFSFLLLSLSLHSFSSTEFPQLWKRFPRKKSNLTSKPWSWNFVAMTKPMRMSKSRMYATVSGRCGVQSHAYLKLLWIKEERKSYYLVRTITHLTGAYKVPLVNCI